MYTVRVRQTLIRASRIDHHCSPQPSLSYRSNSLINTTWRSTSEQTTIIENVNKIRTAVHKTNAAAAKLADLQKSVGLSNNCRQQGDSEKLRRIKPLYCQLYPRWMRPETYSICVEGSVETEARWISSIVTAPIFRKQKKVSRDRPISRSVATAYSFSFPSVRFYEHRLPFKL